MNSCLVEKRRDSYTLWSFGLYYVKNSICFPHLFLNHHAKTALWIKKTVECYWIPILIYFKNILLKSIAHLNTLYSRWAYVTYLCISCALQLCFILYSLWNKLAGYLHQKCSLVPFKRWPNFIVHYRVIAPERTIKVFRFFLFWFKPTLQETCIKVKSCHTLQCYGHLTYLKLFFLTLLQLTIIFISVSWLYLLLICTLHELLL